MEVEDQRSGTGERKVRKRSPRRGRSPAVCRRVAIPDSAAAIQITTNLYSAGQTGSIPEKAVRASLGCGNPTALIDLRPGETVLDLGSGGGIDVLLSAKRVGPTRQSLRSGHDR